MEPDPLQLTLTVDAGIRADDEDRAELARRLLQQLIETDVDAVEFARSATLPVGAKCDPVSLCALAVTVAPAAITAMIGMLQVWLSRHERASVSVESGGEKLTLTGTLSSEQKQMVEAFLNRHKT
jgi:hypothetical protein